MKRASVNIFKALSDPNRIRIMKMLMERELCMCEIREVLNLSNSTVSKHLTILRDTGLLRDSKEGKWVNFRINDNLDTRLQRSVINLLRNAFDDDEVIQADAKKMRRVDRNKICGI